MMKRFTAFGLVVLFAGVAQAAELGFSNFGFSGLSQLRKEGAAVPAAALSAKDQDRITRVSLMPQCGSHSLLGFVQTDAEYAEAIGMWTQLLASAGAKVGTPVRNGEMYTLPYETSDGTVVRQFLAEPRQFAPKDEASRKANQAMILGEFHKRNLPIVASYLVDADYLLPTYVVYYLTKQQPRQEDETQLRVLRPGDDLDFDLLGNAKIDVIQKPESWMMVYFGRELGYVTMIAKTEESAQQKLKERVDLLTGAGKVMIGSRIAPLSEPYEDYRYYISLYFYQ